MDTQKNKLLLFKRGIRGNGAQRVAAFAAVNSILPKQLVKMSMRANGLSEEDYQAVLESSVADYLKEAGHDIMILDTYGPGRYQAIDLKLHFSIRLPLRRSKRCGGYLSKTR